MPSNIESYKATEAIGRLAREDFLGQILQRRGLASELATENGDIKLDWVDQLAWAVDHPDVLHDLERLATDLAERGFRHLIWTGMGGSVSAVQALKELGVLDSSALTVHPLNSTDPAALNRVLDAVSAGQHLDSALEPR
ncbi:MAG: hypothetical protein M3R21_09530 [Candidatus Dormibacteraeota bacterium]|nr:hypothetical protein [Candidatus Dormibacteraeota bacterium]